MDAKSTHGLSDPMIDPALVAWLDRITPPKAATPDVPHLELVYWEGRRSMVQFLKVRLDQQLQKIEAKDR